MSLGTAAVHERLRTELRFVRICRRDSYCKDQELPGKHGFRRSHERKFPPRVAPRNMSLFLRDCTADQGAIFAPGWAVERPIASPGRVDSRAGQPGASYTKKAGVDRVPIAATAG